MLRSHPPLSWFPRQTVLNKIDIVYRQSIRAIIDSPFCSANEIVESELGFCKTLIYGRDLYSLRKD